MIRGKFHFRVNDKDVVWKFEELFQTAVENVTLEESPLDNNAYRDFCQLEFIKAVGDMSTVFNSRPGYSGLRLLRRAEKIWKRTIYHVKHLTKSDFNMWASLEEPSPVVVVRQPEA